MKTTMTIENLTYEEIVLLQEILIEIEDNDFLVEYRETFDSLYEKIMNS